jgi:hypothetical protein
MHTCISQIPVCIRGLWVMLSPYAYSDLQDPHMRAWEVSSDAFGPNWVWRKELFLTFIISFFLLIWVPSQRSQVRRFRIKLSLAERIVPYLFQFQRKSLIGTSITKAKGSQKSQTKQILTAILSGGDGFYRDSRKDRWFVRNWSPYAYGDSLYAHGEEGRKFCIWGVPVRITKLCHIGSNIYAT